MDHAIRIEPRQDADLCTLFALAREAFGEMRGWSDAVAVSSLERDVVFVARYDELLAGYIALWEASQTVRVDQILVTEVTEPELVGDRLLDYAEGYALWRGARSVEIVVEPDNTAARRLYGRHGYVPVAAQLFERVLPVR